MKLLVGTTGDFQIICEDSGQRIRFQGYTVVDPTNFISSRVANGQLKLIHQIGDAADDAEWLIYAKESGTDTELAVASFVSAFPYVALEVTPQTIPADGEPEAVVPEKPSKTKG